MHERSRCRGGRRGGGEAPMRDKTLLCVRILDTMQVRRLIAFFPLSM